EELGLHDPTVDAEGSAEARRRRARRRRGRAVVRGPHPERGMSDERRAWLGMVRDVGVAFADLARAELAAIAADLGRSGGALVRALVVAAVAAACAFWTLGLAIYFAVELLARWL